MKPLLLVTTFLSGEGPTGVESHFNQIVHDVRLHGGEAKLVTPYTSPRFQRAWFRPLKHCRAERAVLLYLWCQSLVLQWQLRRLLKRAGNRPVTIYAQSPAAAKAALAARRDGAAWIVAVVHYNVSESEEVVDKGVARPGGPWCHALDRIERETLSRVDQLVFTSDFMRRVLNERLPALRPVPQRTILAFAPRALDVADRKPAERDLIAIGTLEPRKNQSFLLRVLAVARTKGRRYSLTLVGDGPDRMKLEQLAAELGVREQVHFAGFLRNASRLISRHRLLVHAAKRENSPQIIPEALSCGLPVLAAPAGGIPELFRDGVEGHHWNLDRPEEAAQLMMSLLENLEHYSRVAAAARARYDETFVPLGKRWVEFLVPSLRVPDRMASAAATS